MTVRCLQVLLITALLGPPVAIQATDIASQPEPIALPDCPAYKHLCVQTNGAGIINLKTGILRFSGPIRGVLAESQMIFQGDSLQATRTPAGQWERLSLEGNARLEQGNLRMHGSRLHVDSALQTAVVDGASKAPVEVFLSQNILPQSDATQEAPKKDSDSPLTQSPFTPTESATSEPSAETTSSPGSRIQAARVVIDEKERRVYLSGNVRIEQLDGGLLMESDESTFHMGGNNRLEGFRLQGGVRITQPGRVLSSDLAFSRDDLQTIIMVGSARVQQPGSFDLTGERLEVQGDPGGKASVRSEIPDRPVSLSLKMGGDKNPHELSATALQQLRAQGLPPSVTARLTPLLGHRYATREEFSARIKALLGPDDASRHMETIINASR